MEIQWRYIIILTIIFLGIFLLIQKGEFSNETITGNSAKEYSDSENKQEKKEVKEFNVKAFRFGYSPDSITANKGDKVKINIDNTDTLHGIYIPEYEIRENDVAEFTADKTGEFTWYCAVMCGSGHREMKGKLIVK